MPPGRKRAMAAQMIPTMGTPKYITAAGLTSANWTKFTQTRRNDAANGNADGRSVHGCVTFWLPAHT